MFKIESQGQKRLEQPLFCLSTMVFGLIAQEKDIRFAARALRGRGQRDKPVTDVTIRTRRSPLNILAEIGVAIIPFVGLVAPLFFNPRSGKVAAQQ